MVSVRSTPVTVAPRLDRRRENLPSPQPMSIADLPATSPSESSIHLSSMPVRTAWSASIQSCAASVHWVCRRWCQVHEILSLLHLFQGLIAERRQIRLSCRMYRIRKGGWSHSSTALTHPPLMALAELASKWKHFHRLRQGVNLSPTVRNPVTCSNPQMLSRIRHDGY